MTAYLQTTNTENATLEKKAQALEMELTLAKHEHSVLRTEMQANRIVVK